MVVAPTFEPARRVCMQISGRLMPVVSGVSSSHSPLPSSLNFATESVPSSSSFEVSAPGA